MAIAVPSVSRRAVIAMPDRMSVGSPRPVRIALPDVMPRVVPAAVIARRTAAKQRHQHEQTPSHSREDVQIQHSWDCPPPRTHLSTPAALADQLAPEGG